MLFKHIASSFLLINLLSGCLFQITETPDSLDVHDADESLAKGSIHINGEAWQVVDVLAIQNNNNKNIIFTDHPFNRDAFTADGKLDNFDLLRHKGHTLTLNFEGINPNSCIDYTNNNGAGSKCSTDFPDSITLKTNTESGISGAIQWGEQNTDHIQVTFEVPWSSNHKRVGEPLPENGGEPGAVLLAYFSALANGHFEAIKAELLPDHVDVTKANKRGEKLESISLARALSPKSIKILDGTLYGEHAVIHFSGHYAGTNPPESMKGVAELVLYQERWYVDKISELH